MARDWKTTYSAAAAAASHTMPFPSNAIAGRSIVAFAAAPATIDPPAGWTEIQDPIGNAMLSASQKIAAGGETGITWVREPATSTAPRTLAGWAESRDDMGSLVPGTDVGYASTAAVGGNLDFGSIAVAEGGSRIYLCVAQAQPSTTWTPVWSGATVQDTFTAPGHGEEPIRMSVAVVEAATSGSYPVSVSGLDAGTFYQAVRFVIEPEGADPPPEAINIIEEENRLDGVAKSVWDGLSGAGSATIQGYATAMSVAQGGTLSLKVHSPSAAWTGKVYRLGYYGGDGACEKGDVSGAQTTQPNGTTDGTTNMHSCANWTINETWDVPADATPGVYLIKIWRNDNTALASHIGPFVVRDPARKAPVTVMLADATWQAYNHAGATASNPLAGRNLYGQSDGSSFAFNPSLRAKAVSYDRPFVTRAFIPQTWYFNAEYPLHRYLERLGVDVDYVSCLDVHADGSVLLDRDLVIVGGHNEYWSEAMVDAAEAARDHPTQASNFLWIAGNDVFWHINMNGGNRSFHCWKDTLEGTANGVTTYGGTWQDTRVINPDRRPPALLNGGRFRLNGIPPSLTLGATAEHADLPLWRDTAVAALAGGAEWESTGYIVGFEANEPADMDPDEAPDGMIRLSEIVHAVTGLLADDDGATYTGSGDFTHGMVAFPSAAGAVFHTNTVQFPWALDDTHDRHPGGTLEDADLQQAFVNMLVDFGAELPEFGFPVALTYPTAVPLTDYGFPAVATEGQAAFGLTLTLATTGEAPDVLPDAPAEGEAALGIVFTLATTGSNGSTVDDGYPTLYDLVGDRTSDSPGYLGLNSWTDEDVEDALAAERWSQARQCAIPAGYFPPDLKQALMRRVMRNLAFRRVGGLAVLRGDTEGGSTYLPGQDAEVRRFERNYRRLIMG